MNVDDRIVAMDALTMTKHGVEDLTRSALECSNPRLRQTLRQMRDEAEQSQEKIGQIAQANNWYLASGAADHENVRKVQNFFAGAGAGAGMGAGPAGAGFRETRDVPPTPR